MTKSKKLKKSGHWSGLRASALALFLVVGSFAIPSIALAQDDAGAAAPVEAIVAPDTISEVAPAPSPAADVPASAGSEVAVAAPVLEAAPAAPGQTSLDKLSSELLNILIPIFVLLVGVLATALLNWIRKKLKLEVSDKQIASWAGYAEIGAARAAEWSRNKAKGLTEGKKVPGPEVLEVAINFAIELGVEHGLPEMGRQKLRGLIESQLHTKRENGG